MSRRSYGKLLQMPGWGFYKGGELIATIRAPNEEAARQLFAIHEFVDGTIKQVSK